MTSSPSDPRARTARAKAAQVVLVCRKCAKRQGLSGKAACRLAKAAAKRAAKAQIKAQAADGAGPGRRAGKARVVETSCLGPCPKRLLAVATGESLAAGRVVLLDPRADRPGIIPDFGPNAALAAGRPAAGPATDSPSRPGKP